MPDTIKESEPEKSVRTWNDQIPTRNSNLTLIKNEFLKILASTLQAPRVVFKKEKDFYTVKYSSWAIFF